MNIIETEKLTKYYTRAGRLYRTGPAKIRGIVDLDLAVPEGSCFGFIGPNGAGKSTTIRTLLGLLRATSGRARIFGKDCASRREEILSEVGFMPAEASFYSGMRVGELLRFSASLYKRDCGKRAGELCERLQLDPLRKIDQLSLGNRKKVGIVCALQHSPRLLILDEPSSGLDPLMQREFFSLLSESHKEGATIFLSSHVLSEIQRFCSHAAIIREGRLAACGDVAKLSRSNAKRVTLYGKADLSQLAGIRDRKKTEQGETFLYSGEIRPLIGALSQAELTDITIAEPDLEEVFLHYYGEEEGAGKGEGEDDGILA